MENPQATDAVRQRFPRERAFNYLFRMRRVFTVMAVALPIAGAAGIIGLHLTAGWVSTPDKGTRQMVAVTDATVLATILGLLFAGAALVVQFAIGFSSRVLLRYRALIQGALFFAAIFGQAIALDVIAIYTRAGAPVNFLVPLVDSAVTFLLFPLIVLLLVSVLSPECLISGVTLDVQRLVTEEPGASDTWWRVGKNAVTKAEKRHQDRAYAEVEALGNYATQCARAGNRDALVLAADRLVDLAVLAAAGPGMDDFLRSWPTSYNEKWLIMAGDPSPRQMLSDGGFSPSAEATVDQLNHLARASVRIVVRLVSITYLTATSGDPLDTLPAVAPFHGLGADLGRLAGGGRLANEDDEDEKKKSTWLRGAPPSAGVPPYPLLDLVADAYVIGWSVAGMFAVTGKQPDLVWRSLEALKQAAISYDQVDGLPMASLDAWIGLCILVHAVQTAPEMDGFVDWAGTRRQQVVDARAVRDSTIAGERAVTDTVASFFDVVYPDLKEHTGS